MFMFHCLTSLFSFSFSIQFFFLLFLLYFALPSPFFFYFSLCEILCFVFASFLVMIWLFRASFFFSHLSRYYVFFYSMFSVLFFLSFLLTFLLWGNFYFLFVFLLFFFFSSFHSLFFLLLHLLLYLFSPFCLNFLSCFCTLLPFVFYDFGFFSFFYCKLQFYFSLCFVYGMCFFLYLKKSILPWSLLRFLFVFILVFTENKIDVLNEKDTNIMLYLFILFL